MSGCCLPEQTGSWAVCYSLQYLSMFSRVVCRAPLFTRSVGHRINKVYSSAEEAVADIPNNATMYVLALLPLVWLGVCEAGLPRGSQNAVNVVRLVHGRVCVLAQPGRRLWSVRHP